MKQSLGVNAHLPVLDLGTAPYEPLAGLQARLRRAVAEGRLTGVLLLLEHQPIITLGVRGGPADLLEPEQERIPVAKSERGGAATLHAPGQLISYPLIALPERNLHRYVLSLEEVLIQLLAGYGITAERRPKRPGLYISGQKIASLGLRCERWVASYGTSLNVSTDLSLFDLIVTCGEPGLRQTSVLELLGWAPGMAEIKEAYRGAFQQVLKLELGPIERAGPATVEARLGLTSGEDT